ncbi:MAG: YbaB/EbfC family nucleoid-associated protein [Acidobacteriota bacterium]
MNYRKLLKQAEEMQAKMQRELGETTTEASIGGGMVTVTMNGHKMLLGVKIDPEVIDPEDPDMLQDLIVAAVNRANEKIDEELRGKVGALAGGLPNLF